MSDFKAAVFFVKNIHWVGASGVVMGKVAAGMLAAARIDKVFL